MPAPHPAGNEKKRRSPPLNMAAPKEKGRRIAAPPFPLE
jgi:hypothetical protein|tara:strand:- start:6617 stop:6733 length:117 start_codon:yes stop_codon:yes gene_type:complete